MDEQEIVFALLAAAARISRSLDRSLSSIKGISFSEYQLLSAIRDTPGRSVTRVDLADLVGLSPSGVTRALKPLEKLGLVATARDGRDARRALASLTPAGEELVTDAQQVVEDTLAKAGAISTLTAEEQERMFVVLQEMADG